MRLFVVLFISLFAMSQQSEPPSPTPSPARQQKQHKTTLKHKQSTEENAKTEQLLSTIQQLLSEIQAERKQELAAQAKNKPSSNRGASASTFFVTIFTGILAVVAVLQWLTMKRQAEIFHRQAEIANTQTDISAKQMEIAAEQLAISKGEETRRELDKMKARVERDKERELADNRYLEQLNLTKENAATAKQAADAAKLSAEATEKSVALQETAQKQWVNLDRWWGSTVKGRERFLALSFQVVNPTKLPLTMHAIVTRIGSQTSTMSSAAMTVLAPGNPYIAETAIDLSDDQLKRLITGGGLAIQIECSVLFVDCHGRQWEQIFGRALLLRIKGNDIVEIADVRDTKNSLRRSEVREEQ